MDLTIYMKTVISKLERDRKRPITHTYRYALKSFMDFSDGEAVSVLMRHIL